MRTTVRLTSPSLELAEKAAESLGVSRDYYLERVLAREGQQLDEKFRPSWWTDPVPGDQEELPLQKA